MGDIPLMTPRGTFIINGAERVVVSQIHRSPGVIFSHEKGIFSSRIIPYRGSWLEFEIDQKKELIFAKIDRKKKILATVFLRALGFDTREKIIDLFYKTKQVTLSDSREDKEKLLGMVFARAVYHQEGEETKKIYRAGDKIHPHDVEELIHSGIKKIEVIDFANVDSLHSSIILNCFEREEVIYSREDPGKDEPTKEECISRVYSVIKPGEPITLESAEKDLQSMFFSARRYDLGRVGRYKLNKKFDYGDNPKTHTLLPEDITNTMRFLIEVYIGERYVDDIDHLGNRRIRSVGELLTNHLKIAFTRMERIAKERMSLKEADTIRPQDLISIKPIVATIKEFFGSSQLSQFMDQVNPLAELTHKRRLNALGPGGLSRDRAGFEVRDVHYSHYGRMCPIETPEGPNIGLIVSLANYTRVNEYGFLESPYRKVVDGIVSKEIEYLSAIDEEKFFIAQANAPLDKAGKFQEKMIPVRKGGDYTTRKAKDIQYMDVSPKQIISVSTSLIPFLEHDDANRALMGSNMQRQAVPLLRPDPPRVGTGMERKTAYDSGVVVVNQRPGKVAYVSSDEILVKPDHGKADELDLYKLIKFQRTNQDTCFSQKPIVAPGQKVATGDVLADGPATYNGELALGRNVLVAFMPWNGYNYEDAILISETLVREDNFTSIHIKEFSVEVRETKLGPEKITRDIPNASENALEHLDEEGIIYVGAEVKSGSILVGKVTPKSETDSTPEFKLLNSIFGEKAKDVRDTSLRVPHGIEGTVIDVQRLKRSEGDELNPGVEEVVKILIATKRKLQEGDKMAGRHGNKGVIARVLPEEDMPFMEDGTPIDLVLNPLGVPSRMNLGQIMETELGWAGMRLHEWYATPVFESATNEMIEAKLKEASLPLNSKVTLHDGLTGEPFENPVTVGYIYMMKLHHLVDDKMHARSTGPYSLVTQQPLGGKAQFGGQRLGEMEVWALEAYGAANTLQELLTIKSDDMSGRAKVYESIVKNEAFNQAGIPESFNVLVQELRGLALDISIYDAKGKQVALTERDEELINRQGSRF
jgi:DNA-directed RNA polymerase subunit beta